MLFISTLRNKSELVKDEETILDLTAGTFTANDVDIRAIAVVSNELEMRPDLLAKIYYGNEDKLDYVLKFNGISNPFSLEAGTHIFIGEESHLDACFVKSTNEKKDVDIRQDILAPRASKKDNARLKQLQERMKESAKPGTGLTPNFAALGNREMTDKGDGSVVLGQDSGVNKENCQVPVGKAATKAKLLSRKIFRSQ